MKQPKHATLDTLRDQLKDWMAATSTNMVVTTCVVAPRKKVDKSTRTVADVRMVLNDCLQLTGLRVIAGANGPFLAYPCTTKKGEFRSIFYPFTVALRDYLEDTALTAYAAAQEKLSGNT